MKGLGLAAVLAVALATPAAAAQWVGSWGAAPTPVSPADAPPARATPVFNNQSIRQIVRVSAGGQRVRLKLTNTYGTQPLTIGAARIGVAEGAQVKAGTDKAVTFNGKAGVTIPAGAPMLSDPVDLPVEALSSLAITLYVPGSATCTCHPLAMQTGYVATGDQTGAAEFPTATVFRNRAFLAGVEVESARPAKAVVTFGDSITDGVGSTADANRRWPDLLAERLAARYPRQGVGVINMGISGNRILADGAGVSALARFDADVLTAPGVAYVIVFEGVNDIGVSYGRNLPPGALSAGKVTADDLINGYKQIIERAHARGVKVFGATIAPYEGATYWAPEGEAVRQAVNTWIRTSKAFDGVIDFDAVLRDPAKPSQMKDGLHSGDHLHGSDAGYKAMAESIDLNLFR